MRLNEKCMGLFCAVMVVTLASAAQAVTYTGGNAIVDHPDHDGASGSIFVMNDLMPSDGNLTQWAFFDNNFAGRSITPILMEKVGSDYLIRGIGTTRTSTAGGAQSQAFGLVSGSDVITNGNFFFGWKDGGAGTDNQGVPEGTFAGNPDEYGVRYFGTHTTFSNNENLGTGTFFNREYSLSFTVANATSTPPPPAAFSASTLTGALDLSQQGILVQAFNTGGGPSVTIAGINFLAAPANFPLGSQFTGANPLNATSDANLNTLLNSESFGTNPLTLTGLLVGEEYLLQLFMTDNRAGLGGRTVSISGGGGSIVTPGIGVPQSVLISFTALSNTQVFSFNGSAGIGYLGGFQLRQTSIPEPATAALGLMGLGGLMLRRRRLA